ncbi:MAG: pantoate--beta-alanine ligase [Porphyromonas sp.]|nr:pantoate--beta-alanine ligase [Porphyromonas sp.]
MRIATSKAELTALLDEIRGEKLVGFVPTMGGLHEGHMSLVERSMRECELTVVSLFLNPTQFNDPNDLKTYPHNSDDDLKMLAEVGVDVVFMPTPEDMYAPGEEAPEYDLGTVGEVMEGERRPGHFRGVVWVVSKLFRLVKPNKAYFGLKDFQQIAVIRRMIELSPDMEGIEIISCPVVRESDGLAMSSRNRRLSPEQREAAPKIYQALQEGKRRMGEGQSVSEVRDRVISMINEDPILEVEYFSIVDSNTLEEIEAWNGNSTGCITVYCGGVRLIDHITFEG